MDGRAYTDRLATISHPFKGKSAHTFPVTSSRHRHVFPWTSRPWILASWALYIASFVALEPFTGPAIGALALLPIAWTAWSTGWKGGLLAGLINIPLTDALLVWQTGQPFLQVAELNILGQTIFAWLGAIMGTARDYTAHVEDQNQQLREAQEALRQRDRILSAVADASGRMVAQRGWRDGVASVLARIGRSMGITKVSLYRRTTDGGTRLEPVAFWASDDDAEPTDFASFDEATRKALIRDLGKNESARMPLPGDGVVRSATVMPLQVQDALWGAVMFEDTRPPGSWTRMEVDALHSLAVVLSAAIQQEAVRALEDEAKSKSLELEQAKAGERFKTQFLNNAAHELATPLTPLMLQVTVLQKKVEETDDGQHRSVTILARNIRRLQHLVQDLLDSARVQSKGLRLNMEPLDMGTLVNETLESFEEQIKASGAVLEVDARSGATVVGDEVRLTQVLFNFISNALKFVEDGGKVTVTVEADSGTVTVRVTDDGIGFEPHQADHAFQPFTRLHEGHNADPGGSGLGLYIAQAIIDQHDGEIGCSSPGLGRGASFWIRLPRQHVVRTPVAPASAGGSRQ